MASSAKPSMLRTALAQSLRLLRQRRGLSQERLAFLCGLHRTYISLIERGLNSPTVDALDRLARALDTIPSVLIASAEKQARRHSNG